MEKTRTPGVFKRGNRYAVVYRDADGRQRKESAATYDAARALKRTRDEQAARGEQHVPDRELMTLAGFAAELFGTGGSGEGRYQGRRGAVRDQTRREYRRDLEAYWLPPLGRRPLARITAPEIKRVVAEIASRAGDDYLTDRSIRRLYAPLSALLGTAVEEGVIPSNPARDVKLPSGRDALRQFDADDDDNDDPAPGKARALTREQLAAFLLVVDPRWRVLFELLAATGLRVSEALALRWRDLALDGNAHVKVRRAYVRGVYGPPKSRHGRRDVPLPFALVRALRDRHAATEYPGPDDLVFPSMACTPMDSNNLYHRTLKPAAQEAGASWAGFHAFRHSTASMLIADGRNILQVSRWLGHHSPSFTLDVYGHLMDDGVGAPLDVSTTAPAAVELVAA
jgi:integrase